jgi:molecular chaperone GrpE
MPEEKHKKKQHPRHGEGAAAPAGEATPVEATVSIPEEEHEALKAEADALRAKADEYFDGWQRERADFLNYKKRIEREQGQARENISAAVMKKYLVILDDLERALRNKPTSGEGAVWAEGIELIARKLQSILEAEGIQRMQAENQMFDPSLHEAILQEENPAFESGQITEVIQQGYTLGDRVIRPAQVKVAR